MAKIILFVVTVSALLLGCGSQSTFSKLNPVNPPAVHASTPGNFYSQASVTNPPYGMVAGIFNHGTTPIYLDEVSASVGPSVEYNPTTDGYVGFGFGLSNIEEDQCATAPIWWDDSTRAASGLSLAASSSDTLAHVQQQTCTPHGLPYGVALSGGGFNYTGTNLIPLKNCWDEKCDLMPRSIAPGTGVTVYIARYRASDGAAFGVAGKAVVNFRWHQ